MDYIKEFLKSNKETNKKNNATYRRYSENENISSQDDKIRIIQSDAFTNLLHKNHCLLDGSQNNSQPLIVSALNSAQNTRIIAEKLNLNSNLCESILLTFYLGQPTLGYFGVQTMHKELNVTHKGFNIFTHSLRVVTKIEKISPEFEGLNLSYQIIEALILQAIQKQTDDTDIITEIISGMNTDFLQNTPLEGQIAIQIYSINKLMEYIEILIDNDIIKYENLYHLPLLGDVAQEISFAFYKKFKQSFINKINNIVIQDIYLTTKDKNNSENLSYAKNENFPLKKNICISKALDRQIEVIKIFIKNAIDSSPEIQIKKQKISHIMSFLISFFSTHPECLPKKWQPQNYPSNNKKYIVDAARNYIASMTDEQAIQTYKQIR